MAVKKKTRNLGKPRIAEYSGVDSTGEKREWFPSKVVQEWFIDALGRDSKKPTLDACEKLARKIQIMINRNNNLEYEAIGENDYYKMKDVSPAEELNKKVQKIISAANEVLFAAQEVEEYAGGYQWEDEDGIVTLADLSHILKRIGSFPKSKPPVAMMGRPPEAWHRIARPIAHLIKDSLREIEYIGSLNLLDEKSPIAFISAAAINWAYGINVDATGFASAMRVRDRKKQTNPSRELVMNAKRIQAL